MHEANAALHFAAKQGVEWYDTAPGKPMQNACVESFNGGLRDDRLNKHVFGALHEVRRIVEVWRIDYETVRPHGLPGQVTSARQVKPSRG